MKKSYYENGHYIDITTNTAYLPKNYCELCGCYYNLTVHHYLEQQKCLNDLKSKKVKYPSTWTEEFIKENQKLFTLCLQCHTDVHTLSDKDFLIKYNKEKKYFIFK